MAAVGVGELKLGDVPAAAPAPRRRYQLLRRLLETRLVGTGLTISGLVVLCAVAAPLLAAYVFHHTPYGIDLGATFTVYLPHQAAEPVRAAPLYAGAPQSGFPGSVREG